MAFLDVGLYVTSIRTLKNLILISDAVKSVWFLCFQVESCPLLPTFLALNLNLGHVRPVGGTFQAHRAGQGLRGRANHEHELLLWVGPVPGIRVDGRERNHPDV